MLNRNGKPINFCRCKVGVKKRKEQIFYKIFYKTFEILNFSNIIAPTTYILNIKYYHYE